MHQSRNFQPEEKRFNPLLLLPVVGGAGIALALLCAAGFAAYAIFFYQPSVPKKGTPTPTYEVVRFSQGDAGQATPTVMPVSTPATSAPPQQPPTPTAPPA